MSRGATLQEALEEAHSNYSDWYDPYYGPRAGTVDAILAARNHLSDYIAALELVADKAKQLMDTPYNWGPHTDQLIEALSDLEQLGRAK